MINFVLKKGYDKSYNVSYRELLFEKRNKNFLLNHSVEIEGHLEFYFGETVYDQDNFSVTKEVKFKINPELLQDIAAWSYNTTEKHDDLVLVNENKIIGPAHLKINYIKFLKERMLKDFEQFLEENLK